MHHPPYVRAMDAQTERRRCDDNPDSVKSIVRPPQRLVAGQKVLGHAAALCRRHRRVVRRGGYGVGPEERRGIFSVFLMGGVRCESRGRSKCVRVWGGGGRTCVAQ